MRCPAAEAQAACLVEGSNQHHHHRRRLGGHYYFQFYRLIYFFRISVAGVSVGDSIRLVQLGTAVGRDTMAVGVEYHGGLGWMGCGSAMVTVLLY